MSNQKILTLAEATSKRDFARKKNEKALQNLNEMKELSVSFEPSYPLMESALGEMQNNLNELAACLDRASQLGEEINKSKETAKWIEEYGEFLARKIKAVRSLKAAGKFKSAIEMLREIHIPAELNEFHFVSVYREVSMWLLADLYRCKAEEENKQGKMPLSNDEYDYFEKLVAVLPIGLNPASSKKSMEDYLRGLYFLRASYWLDDHYLTTEVLEAYAMRIQEHLYREYNASKLTQWRFRVLRYRFVRAYNEACKHYFDDEPEYKDALAFFHLKNVFSEDELTHKAYIESENDEAFRVAFLQSDMLRKGSNDFHEESGSISLTIASPMDIPARALAKTYVDPNLGEKRKAILLNEFSSMTFTQKIYFLEAVVKEGISEQDEDQLLSVFESNKAQRKANLEKVSTSLLAIKERLYESHVSRFDRITDSLFRSSKAIKTTIKTPINDVRTLSRLGFKDPPKGKKYVSTMVKGRSRGLFALAWIIGLIVVIGLAFGASWLIHLYCPAQYQPYAYLAPTFFVHGCILFLIVRYCDNDERGSAYARRVLGVILLLLAVLTLFYFMFPVQLNMLVNVGYTLIIGTSVMTLVTLTTLKDFRKRLGFWMYWPTMTLLVASVVFMIINMMNGLI